MTEGTTWKQFIRQEKQKPYFKQLQEKLNNCYNEHTITYPEGPKIFRAFDYPFENIKVVIVGLDPYINPNQATGLAFGISPEMTKIPPSLRNIMKVTGCDDQTLESWAEQGVFLINSILTVEQGKTASHWKYGWQQFTDAAIKKVQDELVGVVFMFWGNEAQKKQSLIDPQKHLILMSTHPSPLSSSRSAKGGTIPAFMTCGHFTKINEYLKSIGKEPVRFGNKNSKNFIE